MRKIIQYMTVALLVWILFSACENQLTKAPLDAPSDITFFSNATELEMAINGVYNQLWWETRNLPFLVELDNATDIGFLRDQSVKTIAQGDHDPDLPVIANIWSHMYTGIARANNILDNLDRAQDMVSEEYLNRITAETRFLRAFYYHYLTEFFGDVPLIVKSPTLEEAQMQRTSKSEVVEQIYSDLDYASQHLPHSWSGSDQGRVTRGAALTLKARVALYNTDYQISIEAAQEVMSSGSYQLHSDYKELFDYAGYGSSEVIFSISHLDGINTHQIPQNVADRNVSAWATHVPSQFMVDTYQMIDGKHIHESDLYDPSSPFENRDPRLDATILRPQAIFAGYVFETHPDSTQTWRIEGDEWIRVNNQNVTNPFASFTGLGWRKYVSEADIPENLQSSELHFIYMRYAEVLLTYAEAKIEVGDIDESVLEAINLVRARAYNTDHLDTENFPAITTLNQEELRRELRYERKVELAMEGFRWFDIRRWGIADQIMNGPLVGRPLGSYSEISEAPFINRDLGHHPEYGAHESLYRAPERRNFNTNRDWLLPIPQREFPVNENLTQNPGY